MNLKNFRPNNKRQSEREIMDKKKYAEKQKQGIFIFKGQKVLFYLYKMLIF